MIFIDKKSKLDNNNQEKIKCDSCGKCQELQKFKLKKKSKRFCSQECLKMLDNNSKTGQTDKKNGKNWVRKNVLIFVMFWTLKMLKP